MRCPSCGANVNSAFCGYCGSKMPVERIETQSIHGDNVVVNNYYYPDSQGSGPRNAQPPYSNSPYNAGAVGARAGQFGGYNPGYNTGYNPGYAGYAPAVSPKSRMVALLLCIFLGMFGAHRFYTGRYLIAIIYLFTLGAFGIGWFVDLILILLGKLLDGNRLPVTRW